MANHTHGMNGTNHTPPEAISYARALLELAGEQQQAEAVGQELRDLRQAISTDPSFQIFLTDPSINQDERAGVIDRALRSKVTPLMFNFLRVLNLKGRLGLIPEITAAYDDLLDALLNKIEVDVTVAQRLGPEELEQVRQRISKALNKDAVVHQYVDESIIGGLVLRVQDQLIDASTRYQLEAMKQQLLAAQPK